MKNLIKDLQLGIHSISLQLQGETPVASYQGQIYAHLWFLVDQIPALSDPIYIKEFAEISNFFWKGIQFKFIPSIPAYQKFYLDRVELERKCPADIFAYRLTDYKIFDVSIMHDPRTENEQLFYFVYQVATGLPYRVVCPFPYSSTSSIVHYQILPLKEPEDGS